MPRSSRSPGVLFAYGTLMRGFSRHALLIRGASYVGEGSVRGTLFDLGPYPGLVDGSGVVRGEVYRLDDPDVLPLLDQEEGEYNFERRVTTITVDGRRRRRAWIYWYTGPRERGRVIPEGDYRCR